jgi:hypothetical protein
MIAAATDPIASRALALLELSSRGFVERGNVRIRSNTTRGAFEFDETLDTEIGRSYNRPRDSTR